MGDRGGAKESERLVKNVQDQLKRLIQQLTDLEELKEELDEDEYAAEKAATLEQITEFEASLGKMTASGQGALVSVAAGAQLAIQAIIKAQRDGNATKLFTDMDAAAKAASASAAKVQTDATLASNFVSADDTGGGVTDSKLKGL
jgi:hypothetical protein